MYIHERTAALGVGLHYVPEFVSCCLSLDTSLMARGWSPVLAENSVLPLEWLHAPTTVSSSPRSPRRRNSSYNQPPCAS